MFNFDDINEKISYRKDGCIVNSIQNKTIEYINLYVQITNLCNAKCKFCSNYGANEIKFYKNLFFEIFDEIYAKKFINKVTFTGGEPTLNNDVIECIKYVRNKDKKILIFIDTNASNLNVVKEISPYVTSIALSRHHFDDNKNNEIFNLKTASSKDLENLPIYTKNKINLRCNLIKGYIDSIDKCKEYLDWCNKININSVGFVKLMPYTEYAKENYINLDISNIPGMKVTKHSCRPGICYCNNYLYQGKYGCIILYDKETINKESNQNTLVLSNNKLLLGFKGEVLYAK